jgi:TRAP-type C4-dicarboxylate transport system permease small subunit
MTESRFFRALERLQKRIGQLEKFFGIVAMAFIVIINVYGIALRYLLNHPVLYVQELTILAAVYLFFIGMGLVFKAHSDISVEFLTRLLPPRLKTLDGIFIDAATVFFTLVLTWQSVKFIKFMHGQNESHAMSFALELPDAIYFYPVAVGAVSIFLTVFHSLLKRLADLPHAWSRSSK